MNQTLISTFSDVFWRFVAIYFSKPQDKAVSQVNMFRQCSVTAVEALSLIQPAKVNSIITCIMSTKS